MSRRAALHPFLAPGEPTGGRRSADVPFQAHVELLQFFLARREDIVERIQGLLNAQRKPLEFLQDGHLLFRLFEDCYFTVARISHDQSRMRGQLEAAHWAGGFKPRDIPGLHNALIDPSEMMLRAFHLWGQTRWPGRSGRIRYAHTLFNLYVVRQLALLSMRLWDAGSSGAGSRLSQVQDVLDRLWTIAPADQPALVRDARWLIPIAQSPATDDLAAYFDVAEKVAVTLPETDRVEIHAAGVRMAGAHLRSQIRYYSTQKGVPPDDERVVLSTRTSNALDFALLIQDLVPLLDAYDRACHGADGGRLRLAGAICQGLSPDPELFLNRMELLAAYSMIEHLFLTADGDGHAVYTPMGQRHVRLLRDYEGLIGRVSKALHEDCARFRPAAGAYSPYGVLYGFSSNLVEHIAFATLRPEGETRFSLEDVFLDGQDGTDKLAWVTGWRKLPHLAPDAAKLFDYPQEFAEAIFDRLDRALRRRASDEDADIPVRTGRIFVVAGECVQDSEAEPIPDLPARYILASDRLLAAAHKADFCDEPRLASDRREGRCVLSYETPGGRAAITKDFLTEMLGAGRDVKIAGLPPAAARALTLMCPNLVFAPEDLPS